MKNTIFKKQGNDNKNTHRDIKMKKDKNKNLINKT